MSRSAGPPQAKLATAHYLGVKGRSKLNYSYSDDFFKLNYSGTDTPIKLGDYVIYSEWFGLKRTEGRVSYIPRISPLCSDLSDSEKSSLWGISVPGDFIQMLYACDDKFISKKIKFVRREDDNYCGLQPNQFSQINYNQINYSQINTAKKRRTFKNSAHQIVPVIKLQR